MKTALIGSTGFVGSNLRCQISFDAHFHASDIQEIMGRGFDLVVCAGAPATKWQANAQPEADRANLAGLMDCLRTIQARRFILISTVDVYPQPAGVYEQSPIDPSLACAYGRHRFELEGFARERFDALIVRLPGLFGPGLKKNMLFDLLHGHAVAAIHPAAQYQFYNIRRLWHDLQRALEADLRLINLATEPTQAGEIARDVFGSALKTSLLLPPPRYDFRTRSAGFWGRQDGYLYGKDQIMGEIQTWAREEARKRQ